MKPNETEQPAFEDRTGRAGGSLTEQELMALGDEIAAMARAGLPLDQGLAAMSREMRAGRLARVTREIAEDLRQGRSLPDALQRQAGRVPDFYPALIQAAIRSGRIGEVLATLTAYARSIADLRSTLWGAIFYPGVVLTISFGLFCFVAWLILPQFEEIFRDFGLKLPRVTLAMLQIGRHTTEFLILPPAAAILSFLLIRFGLIGTAGGRRAWARLIYSLPLIGGLVRASRLAAFCDLLSILVTHHTPLPEAFRLAGEATSDPLLADATRLVEQDLIAGRSMGESLRGKRAVPELICWMAGFGERRGKLGESLHEVAEIYRRQVEVRAAMLRNVLPPVFVVATGGILVGFFALAIFMPLIDLLASLI